MTDSGQDETAKETNQEGTEFLDKWFDQYYDGAEDAGLMSETFPALRALIGYDMHDRYLLKGKVKG